MRLRTAPADVKPSPARTGGEQRSSTMSKDRMLRPGTFFGLSAVCALVALSTPAAVAAAAPLPVTPAVSHHRGHGGPPPAPYPGWVDPPGSGPGSLGTALAGSTPTGTGPSWLAFNPATHTVYVTNGENDNGPNASGDTVSVIDTRDCQAEDVARCRGPWPTITVGNLPSSIAVDQATDTVYVTNWEDGTVSVFNGATCNAMNTSGCGQHPATVPVGLGPLGIYVDDANHTVYVANQDDGNGPSTVSMIDSATSSPTMPPTPST
jgi:YVTN family beta-propeller protein